jgi:hypothetical protein
VSQGLAGDNLVRVSEAKSGSGHAPVVGDVGEVFALGDVDGYLAALNMLLVVLSAFILGALFDSGTVLRLLLASSSKIFSRRQSPLASSCFSRGLAPGFGGLGVIWRVIN